MVRFLDRVLLGFVMSVVVIILERVVLRTTRKKPPARLGMPARE